MKPILIAVLATALIIPSAALAQEQASHRTAHVSLLGVRFSDAASMGRLKARIERAARRVCDRGADTLLGARMEELRCRKDSVARAESDVRRIASRTLLAQAQAPSAR